MVGPLKEITFLRFPLCTCTLIRGGDTNLYKQLKIQSLVYKRKKEPWLKQQKKNWQKMFRTGLRIRIELTRICLNNNLDPEPTSFLPKHKPIRRFFIVFFLYFANKTTFNLKNDISIFFVYTRQQTMRFNLFWQKMFKCYLFLLLQCAFCNR